MNQVLVMPMQDEAFQVALKEACDMLVKAGEVTPTLVAMVRESAAPKLLWRMRINDMVGRGEEGRNELLHVSARLTSGVGYDLTAFGVPKEQCHCEWVAIVTQGEMKHDTGALAEQTFPAVALELIHKEGSAVQLMKLLEATKTEIKLELVTTTQMSAVEEQKALRMLH